MDVAVTNVVATDMVLDATETPVGVALLLSPADAALWNMLMMLVYAGFLL